MHAALVANTTWLDEELSMFRYLVVGLIDEQVRVAQVVPEHLPENEASAFGERVVWRDSDWALLRRLRLPQLAGPLRGMGVDLIHALDGQTWDGALRLARRLGGAPLVLTASSAGDLESAPRAVRAASGMPCGFTATTAPLTRALRDRLPTEIPVELMPPGVRVPSQPNEPSASREDLCIVVAGDGQIDQAYQNLLQAIVPIVAEHPSVQFFFDALAADQHKLWRAARKLGLLTNMSMVSRRLGHRELLLGADAILQPQALGRSRSLTLQAMAHGVPVVARQDDWLDYLIDERTAWVIDRSDPGPWEAQLRRVVEQRDEARQLGQRAREWVTQHHVPANLVGQVLHLYRQLSGEAIRFPGE